MTANEFRKVALSLPEVVESAHMEHPDFRVGGRIFATLGYPEEGWGVVMLSVEEQKRWCEAAGGFCAGEGSVGEEWEHAGEFESGEEGECAGGVAGGVRGAGEEEFTEANEGNEEGLTQMH